MAGAAGRRDTRYPSARPTIAKTDYLLHGDLHHRPTGVISARNRSVCTVVSRAISGGSSVPAGALIAPSPDSGSSGW
jgi:hypothetical protein